MVTSARKGCPETISVMIFSVLTQLKTTMSEGFQSRLHVGCHIRISVKLRELSRMILSTN